MQSSPILHTSCLRLCLHIVSTLLHALSCMLSSSLIHVLLSPLSHVCLPSRLHAVSLSFMLFLLVLEGIRRNLVHSSLLFSRAFLVCRHPLSLCPFRQHFSSHVYFPPVLHILSHCLHFLSLAYVCHTFSFLSYLCSFSLSYVPSLHSGLTPGEN